jgi:hypothetical protein
MRHRPAPHPRLLLPMVFLALVAIGACSKQTTAPVVGETAPVPDTPRHAVDLFRWTWGHKSLDRFRELFTDDLVFTAYYLDSALMADTTYTRGREAMIDSAAMVFGSPVAIRLDYLAIDPDADDDRPGKNPVWHRRINVRFNLSVTVPGVPGAYIAHPVEEFYVVRGDSALIPQELVDRGFGPDSGRWYISDWTDYTAVTAPPALPGGAGARGSGEATPAAARPRGWPFPAPPASPRPRPATLASAPRVR